MKDLFKRTTTSIIVSSVVAFILGLVMAVVPGISIQVIGIAAGIYIILHGITLIVLDFMAHNAYVPFNGVITGILSIIVGILLIAMPDALTTVFAIALGIWIILSSVNVISIAMSVRKSITSWYLWLLFGVIDLICGIIILFNPFASSISIVVLGGIIVMVHSVVTIVDMIMIRSRAKEIEKAIKDSIKELKAEAK
ncbi:DUF308 domain-containing protein [Candidatus Saccharibacteria bacterium]|nr:DUF308 domain-containing protein [Candidatus Saccharibacteria bacterium]